MVDARRGERMKKAKGKRKENCDYAMTRGGERERGIGRGIKWEGED